MSANGEPFVLVLDDDPTGSQCAAGVDVLLRPGERGVPEVLAGPARSAYALTNTRARPEAEAVALIRRIRDLTVHSGAMLVLRGDSTLRGHVFAEMAALGLDRAAGLLVPAFPAAGRVTVGGVHYLTTSGEPVNVADTEFARDPVFGFRARTLPDWVAEVGGPRPVYTVQPSTVDYARAVRDGLLRIPDGGVVVPDVHDGGDLRAIAAGLDAARRTGRAVVVRTAAPLAALIAGVPGRPVPPPQRPAGRVLVVCGSHTGAATAQLDALPHPRVVLPTDAAADPGTWAAVAGELTGRLDRDGVAVLCSERVRRREHGTLADGAAVMAGLMAVVRRLAPGLDAIVAKGGITSAEVATTGLDGTVATVAGQIEVGISLWRVASGWGTRVPVAIVPGNIGDAGTLTRMLAYFGPRA